MVEALITALLILIFYVIPGVVGYVYVRKIFIEINDVESLSISEVILALVPIVNFLAVFHLVSYYREESGKKRNPKYLRKFFRI